MDFRKRIVPVLIGAYWLLVGLALYESAVHILNARIPYPLLFAIAAVAGVLTIAAQIQKRIVQYLNSEIRKL